MPRTLWSKGARTTRQSQSRPLLPPSSRPAAVAVVAVCAAALAGLGTWLAGRTEPSWLDTVVDTRMRSGLTALHAPLGYLVDLGDPYQSVMITAALVLLCLAVRRWRGVLLCLLAVPAASGLTELLLKPLIHRTFWGHLEFPSGHTTAVFTQAAICAVLLSSPGWRRVPAVVRTLLALAVLLTAALVAVAVIALGYHYFTDTLGGISVGTGVVLVTAMLIDRIVPGAARRFRAMRPAAAPAQPAEDPQPAPVTPGGTMAAPRETIR